LLWVAGIASAVMSGMDRMLSLPMTIGTATAEPAAM
jgi:hypothetical protein